MLIIIICLLLKIPETSFLAKLLLFFLLTQFANEVRELLTIFWLDHSSFPRIFYLDLLFFCLISPPIFSFKNSDIINY